MMTTCPLSYTVEQLESGSRPRLGVCDSPGVPSLGGEHICADGTVREEGLRYITHDTFAQLRSGKLNPDDILIVKDGATTGKTAFFSDSYPHRQAALNEHVFRLSTKRNIAFPKYVFWYLVSERGQAEILKDFRGATVGGISRGFIDKVAIPIPHKNGKPDLEEQKRIAAILDKADAIRRKRQQALRLTDDFLRSVFLGLFGNPALKAKVKTIVKVSDAGDVQLGRQRAPKYQTGKYKVPYIRVANVYENRIDLKGLLSMDFDQSDFQKYRLEENDILLNEGQSTELVGRPAMWRNEIPDCCFQNTLVRFKARKGEVEPYYALFVFLHYLWYGVFASLSSKTSSVAHLGAGRFSEMPFPLADYSKQQEFAKLAEKVYRTQRTLSVLQGEAENLFSSLQQSAFSGEL
jgi:type I restriction enzyme, S subunit